MAIEDRIPRALADAGTNADAWREAQSRTIRTNEAYYLPLRANVRVSRDSATGAIRAWLETIDAGWVELRPVPPEIAALAPHDGGGTLSGVFDQPDSISVIR